MEDIDKIVTDIITEQLKKGIVPWQKTWIGRDKPYKYTNGECYKGINLLLLGEGGEYIPYREYQQMVLKDPNITEKTDVNWQTIVFTYEENHKWQRVIHKVAHIKYFSGIPSKLPAIQIGAAETRYDAEKVIQDYCDRENISILNSKGGNSVYYEDNKITIPNKEQYQSLEYYFLSLLHELIHSTSVPLKRKMGILGNSQYSLEELTAEIGACMLMNELNIPFKVENSLAYINAWYTQLKRHKKMISIASNQAIRAVQFILKGNE